MPVIRYLPFFFSLYLTLISGTLASTIMSSGPIEQDISQDFFLGPDLKSKNEKNSLRFGYFRGEKWARVTLANQSSSTIEKLLYFDTLTGTLDLYKHIDPENKLLHLGTSGSDVPFNQKEFKSIFAAFKVVLPAQSETTYLLKFKSRHNLNTKVFTGTMETMKIRQADKLSFLDFYAGGILCLVLYNFFIFIFLKDKTYLYYCLFSTSFLLAVLTIHGMLDKIFLSATLSFSHYLICFSSMALMSAIVFTYHFLEISKYLKSFATYYKTIFALCLGLFIIGLTPLEDLTPDLFGGLIDFLLLSTNLAFIICAFKLLKVSTSARFYLLSWMIIGVSLLIWFGMTFGFLPNNVMTQHSLLFASLGQMLALSLALAFRINKVTEEKLAAEERALQKEKYHRLVRVLSHDIANSLTIINSYTKKLIKPKNLEPGLQRILEKIYFAGDNIKNILTNVREEELLAERKKSIELHPVNIYESMVECSIVFEEHLRHKNLELQFDIPGELSIMANKTCFLNNIVNNIISNSIKFSHEHSKITVKASSAPDKMTITFRDNGRGIDPDLIKDIFFSNRLISSQGTEAEIGHGFGATLMREYVELFGGSLEVQSSNETAASGTIVILTFPQVC